MWLSVLGDFEWSGNNPLPPEVWLLPYIVPFHPASKNFSRHQALENLWHNLSYFFLSMDRFPTIWINDPQVFAKRRLRKYSTIHGFYVQLWPRILEHIGANRRIVEKELTELLKLCHWDCIDNYLALENFKRSRLKLRKIVKKYTSK